MMNKCNDMHKYGPFKKNDDCFYRICLRCNKKTNYPICDEINDIYNRQIIVEYITNILIKKDLSIIQNDNYFFRLIACFLDDISYVYLSDSEQKKLLKSIREFNDYYYSNKDMNRYNIVSDAINYLNDYFYNYNQEIKNIYDEELSYKLDDDYIFINRKLDLELENIILSEENTVVTVVDEINMTDNVEIDFDELQNESD